jgi:hypothetical protein
MLRLLKPLAALGESFAVQRRSGFLLRRSAAGQGRRVRWRPANSTRPLCLFSFDKSLTDPWFCGPVPGS